MSAHKKAEREQIQLREELQPHGIVKSRPPRGQGETVLVVDDNEMLRSLMTEVVTELGYRSLEAADAYTAVPILKSTQPIDLLVTDVGLPIINGHQLAEIARQHRPDLGDYA